MSRFFLIESGEDLSDEGRDNTGINHGHFKEYGYTNEHEFFAVLAEYFFESPEILKRKDPVLYGMLQSMFHQDPASLSGHLQVPRRIRRNAPCPCGSGKKFKNCCQLHLTG